MTALGQPALKEQHELFAYYLSKIPNGHSHGDVLRDWLEAKEMQSQDWVQLRQRLGYSSEEIVWERRVRAAFQRRYLALEAHVDPIGLEASFEAALGKLSETIHATSVLLAVLDGAPEYSRACYVMRSNNGRRPEQITEQKDSRFCEFCWHTFSLYGGTFLDQAQNQETIRFDATSRSFQDGCAVVFAEDKPLRSALTAAVALHQTLSAYNQHKSLRWDERLNARIVVGSSWKRVIPCLCRTWRNETVVEQQCLVGIDSDYKELLFAAGVRAGPHS